MFKRIMTATDMLETCDMIVVTALETPKKTRLNSPP